MTPPAAEEPKAPRRELPRIDGELMADWVTRLREDMHSRAQNGTVPRVEEYLQSFPEFAADKESVLELISMERQLRHEAGEEISTGFFVERFPHLHSEIEEQLDFDLMIDEQAAEHALANDDDTSDDELDLLVPGPPSGATPVPPPLPERYQPIRPLGRGGFADVWLCRDHKMNRPVAVKRLHRKSTRISERFRREAKMAARVRHPNVCVIYDHDLDHSTPYLVLEYVDGQTLREILNAGSPLTIDAAAGIAREIAVGCHACHEKGIVHRDLKPENIKRDSHGHIKILDFGLARPFDPDQTQITSDGGIIGSIQYLSPEQTRAGETTIEAASDQFTLGVILYEMLTGRRPFRSRTIRRELPRSSKSRSAGRSILAGFVPKSTRPWRRSSCACSTRQPADRFASMAKVAEALDAYRAGNKRPVPLPDRRRRWCRALIVVGAALVLFLTAAAGVWRSRGPVSPPTAAGSETTPTAGVSPASSKAVVAAVAMPTPKGPSLVDLMTLIRDDLDRHVKRRGSTVSTLLHLDQPGERSGRRPASASAPPRRPDAVAGCAQHR